MRILNNLKKKLNEAFQFLHYLFEQLSIREHIFAIWLKKYELWISFIADKHKIRLNVIEFDYKAGELTVGLTNVIRYNDEPVYKDVHLDKFEFQRIL